MLETVKNEHLERGAGTKKTRILELYRSGISSIEAIAAISGSKPSYVGSVLQRAGLIDSYFDLYTSTANAMNVYASRLAGKLGFKDRATAESSVVVLESEYREFEGRQDRAGQHHALEMALTMLDRARGIGKLEEAEVYRRWLMGKLATPLTVNSSPVALARRLEDPVEAAPEATLRNAA